MCQTEKEKASKQVGQSKFTLREKLLADILPAIEAAKATNSSFSEALQAELWANADLRNKIMANRNNPLISQRKILNSLPQKAKKPVSQFVRELLASGNRR